MRETTVKSRNCMEQSNIWHTVMPYSGITNQRRWKKSTGSHTVRSSLHTTLPWEPIHKLMDRLHTLSLSRRFTSGKAWAVRTSEEAPSYCGSSSRIIEPSSWGGMVIKHTLYIEVLLLSLMYCLAETFLDLLCSLDCLSPYENWIRVGITNSGLSLTLKVAEKVAGYLANESSHICYVWLIFKLRIAGWLC